MSTSLVVLVQASMDTLTAAVNHAYDAHRDLLEVKQSLEHDIFLKANSLGIDR